MIKFLKKIIGSILILLLAFLLLVVYPIVNVLNLIIYRFKSEEWKKKEKEFRDKIKKEWEDGLKKEYIEILDQGCTSKWQEVCNKIEEITEIKIDNSKINKTIKGEKNVRS